MEIETEGNDMTDGPRMLVILRHADDVHKPPGRIDLVAGSVRSARCPRAPKLGP